MGSHWAEIHPQRHLPNILSLSRVPLGLVFLLLLPRATLLSAAICLLIIALGMVTDYLDGTLARRNKTVSLVGKWIDPLSDFTFFLFVYLSFYRLGLMPLLLFILFLARELTMYTVVRPLYRLKHLDPAAKLPGKAKTVFQNLGSMVIVALILLQQVGLVAPQLVRRVSLPLLFAMVALSLLSMYWYVKPLFARRTGTPSGGERTENAS